MKRVDLTLEGQPRSLEIDGATVASGGRTARAEIADRGDGRFSVLIDDAQHCVTVASLGDGRLEAWVGGSRLRIEIADPRRLAPPSGSGGRSGTAEIRVPMPGKVVAVHVSEGDRVERGQGMLVVEAMKMQNELRAPQAGVVTRLRVNPGDAVAAGAALAVIE